MDPRGWGPQFFLQEKPQTSMAEVCATLASEVIRSAKIAV